VNTITISITPDELEALRDQIDTWGGSAYDASKNLKPGDDDYGHYQHLESALLKLEIALDVVSTDGKLTFQEMNSDEFITHLENVYRAEGNTPSTPFGEAMRNYEAAQAILAGGADHA